jgi:hypothetical protein
VNGDHDERFHLTGSESALARADHFSDLKKARLDVAEAQVLAFQAVAAALDRLAAAVENLRS